MGLGRMTCPFVETVVSKGAGMNESQEGKIKVRYYLKGELATALARVATT